MEGFREVSVDYIRAKGGRDLIETKQKVYVWTKKEAKEYYPAEILNFDNQDYTKEYDFGGSIGVKKPGTFRFYMKNEDIDHETMKIHPSPNSMGVGGGSLRRKRYKKTIRRRPRRRSTKASR